MLYVFLEFDGINGAGCIVRSCTKSILTACTVMKAKWREDGGYFIIHPNNVLMKLGKRIRFISLRESLLKKLAKYILINVNK